MSSRRVRRPVDEDRPPDQELEDARKQLRELDRQVREVAERYQDCVQENKDKEQQMRTVYAEIRQKLSELSKCDEQVTRLREDYEKKMAEKLDKEGLGTVEVVQLMNSCKTMVHKFLIFDEPEEESSVSGPRAARRRKAGQRERHKKIVQVSYGSSQGEFAVTPVTTFRELKKQISRYWGLSEKHVFIQDAEGQMYPSDMLVQEELFPSHGVHLRGKIPLVYVSLSGNLSVAAIVEDKLSNMRGTREKRQEAAMQKKAENAPIKAMTEEEEEEFEKRRTEKRRRYKMLADSVLFVALLLLWNYVWWVHRSTTNFYWLTKSVEQGIYQTPSYPNFTLVSNEADMWEWLNGTLKQAIYPSTTVSRSASTAAGFYMGRGYWFPRGQLRQLRVQANADCSIRSPLSTALSGVSCYMPYSSSISERNPFGPGGEGFIYTDSRVLQGSTIDARVSTYDATGYTFAIATHNETLWNNATAYLKNNAWIDQQTSAVFATLNLHVPDSNLFLVVHSIFEFTAGGAVVPTYQLWPLKVDFFDNLSVALQTLTLVVIVYLIAAEIGRLSIAKRGPLGDKMRKPTFWTITGFLMVMFFIASIAVRVAVWSNPNRVSLDMEDDSYTDLTQMAYLFKVIADLDSMVILLSLVTSLQYAMFLAPGANRIGQIVRLCLDVLAAGYVIAGIYLGAALSVGSATFGYASSEYNDGVVASKNVLELLAGGLQDWYTVFNFNRWGMIAYTVFVRLAFAVIAVGTFLAALLDAFKHHRHLAPPVVKRPRTRVPVPQPTDEAKKSRQIFGFDYGWLAKPAAVFKAKKADSKEVNVSVVPVPDK
eukprot:GILJ01009192.1.p1 GENE.GILJ01009192.1~~GILJ01009192.1.p1  ORF type:complete len:821 (+),score=128.28 GILJ01009192.1:36-2498(+)